MDAYTVLPQFKDRGVAQVSDMPELYAGVGVGVGVGVGNDAPQLSVNP